MKLYELVGGPLDGERREIPYGARIFEFPIQILDAPLGQPGFSIGAYRESDVLGIMTWEGERQVAYFT